VIGSSVCSMITPTRLNYYLPAGRQGVSARST